VRGAWLWRLAPGNAEVAWIDNADLSPMNQKISQDISFISPAYADLTAGGNVAGSAETNTAQINAGNANIKKGGQNQGQMTIEDGRQAMGCNAQDGGGGSGEPTQGAQAHGHTGDTTKCIQEGQMANAAGSGDDADPSEQGEDVTDNSDDGDGKQDNGMLYTPPKYMVSGLSLQELFELQGRQAPLVAQISLKSIFGKQTLPTLTVAQNVR
jgi:hypothetical protein